MRYFFQRFTYLPHIAPCPDITFNHHLRHVGVGVVGDVEKIATLPDVGAGDVEKMISPHRGGG